MMNERELGDEVLPVSWPDTLRFVAGVNVMNRDGVCTKVECAYETYAPVSDAVRGELQEMLRQRIVADLVKGDRLFGCSIGPLHIEELARS